MMIGRLRRNMHIFFATKCKVFGRQHFIGTPSKYKLTSQATNQNEGDGGVVLERGTEVGAGNIQVEIGIESN
jgi:hypothetical protein